MTWIGGIESLWKWSPPGAGAPVITLGEGAFRVLEISGLRSLGESEANADARVGGIGENPRLSQRRGKSVAITGRILATSMLELRELESELLAAFDDGTTQGRMDIAPHPDNAELAGQGAKYFEARALSCDIIDSQATKSWSRNFVIGLRMGTPLLYDVEEEAHAVTVTKTKTVYSF